VSYSLATLWHERARYLPGILAVGFSALLIALQFGLLFGLLSVTSLPIDFSHADLWVGSKEVLSVDLGRPIDSNFIGRLTTEGVDAVEEYYQGFSQWSKPDGGSELCMVCGSRLEPDAQGAVDALTPELRAKLTLPLSVVVDESELDRLGLKKEAVDQKAQILGHEVRVVGFVSGYKSLAGPYVFCSLSTARPLLRLQQSQTVYLLGRCKNQADAPATAQRLRDKYSDDMAAFTKDEFSWRSEMHWLTKTKAGIALGYSALLGLLVGAAVTTQTLYAATAASIREYAILQALGIPRRRIALSVLEQTFWVGLAGVTLAIPTIYGLARVAELFGTRVVLMPELMGGVVAITLTMAAGSGLFALRSLRLIEPANLLR
jgi:putative ABC transport system permease protein